MNDVYTERILAYWEKALHFQHPSTITHKAEVQSLICGDNVYCELNIQNGILIEIGIFPRGCCLCNAAAAITAEYFTGKTVEELNSYTEEDLLTILKIIVPCCRQSCVSLSWHALRKALQ